MIFGSVGTFEEFHASWNSYSGLEMLAQCYFLHSFFIYSGSAQLSSHSALARYYFDLAGSALATG